MSFVSGDTERQDPGKQGEQERAQNRGAPRRGEDPNEPQIVDEDRWIDL